MFFPTRNVEKPSVSLEASKSNYTILFINTDSHRYHVVDDIQLYSEW